MLLLLLLTAKFSYLCAAVVPVISYLEVRVVTHDSLLIVTFTVTTVFNTTAVLIVLVVNLQQVRIRKTNDNNGKKQRPVLLPPKT